MLLHKKSPPRLLIRGGLFTLYGNNTNHTMRVIFVSIKILLGFQPTSNNKKNLAFCRARDKMVIVLKYLFTLLQLEI
jgi:hypothetical protein